MSGGIDVVGAHVLEVIARPEQIDALGHVTNAVYVQWLTDVSWDHSQALGIGAEQFAQLDRAMAISRHEIDYLQPALQGDVLQLATAIIECDNRLRMVRYHQIYRPADGQTLLRARTSFVCIRMRDGRPVRMPQAFIDVYGPAVIAVDRDA